MSHRVVQKIEDLIPGTLICAKLAIKDFVEYVDCEFFFHEVKGTCLYGNVFYLDPNRDSPVVTTIDNYRFSLLDSPDFDRDALFEDNVTTWAACERAYGITHLGSQDPDPLRDLAFKILKGDPQALDAAKDILKV